jgi:hypothetical protein
MRSFRLLISFLLSLLVMQAMSQNTATLKGVITDENSKETLLGTTVFLKGTTTGTTSDLQGAYAIENIAPGKWVVVASFVGYSAQEKEVTLPDKH